MPTLGTERSNPVQTYEKPVVKDYGDLTELTAATLTGNQTDVGFGTAGFQILSCNTPHQLPTPCITLP
jgi:hypothetical protein